MKKLMLWGILLVCVFTINAQTFTSFEEAAENQKKYSPVSLKFFKPLSSDEDTVRFTGVFFGQVAGGEKYAWLEDELVVIDKTTKKFKRIYNCGNTGKFWIKKEREKKEEKYIPLSMLASLQVPGSKGEKGDRGSPGRDGKNVIIQESNSTGKILVPTSFGVAGFFAGGYGFPVENEIITQIVIPGTKVQSGDGTIIFGPQRIKTDIHTEKNFNWTGAAIGVGSGLILGYLLNEVIF